MEQRKRESLIPKGTFDVGPTLDPVDRGDASGTFARMVSEAPAAPIARIGLVRQPAPVAPPPATRRALRAAPPPPPASVRPTSMLPPPPPPSRSVEPSLQALVAPTYPPPALLLDESERVEFPDFGLRLDVPRLAPAPVSLLPLPNERSSDSKRGLAKWALLAVLLSAVGVAGWFSRGLVASAPVAAPRAPSTPEPAVVAPVAVAPVAAPVVEEVNAPVVEEVTTAVAEEVVAPEALVVEAATVAPVLELIPVQQPVASARSVAAVPEPRAAAAVAPTVETTVTVEPTVAAVEEAPAAVLEEVLAEELPETLERAEVIEGIEVLRNEYNSCVGDLHGIAQMRIRIANTGRVTHALAEGAYAGTPQGSCLARTLRQARFRPFVRSSIEIVYPLAL